MEKESSPERQRMEAIENFLNKPPFNGSQKRRFESFVDDRKIDLEDFEIIEQLSKFPKNFFNEFHNQFNLSRERTVRDLGSLIKSLEMDIEKTTDEEEKNSKTRRKEFTELYLGFTKKYDEKYRDAKNPNSNNGWYTSNHLNGIFESIPREEWKS